jgi:hypothetical protein
MENCMPTYKQEKPSISNAKLPVFIPAILSQGNPQAPGALGWS